jgi:peptidoglycan/LPS O-acetylase OafA/YrhL
MTTAAMKRLGSDQRVPELDGLRGIAVGMVLIWHFVGGLVDQNLGNWNRLLYDITIFGRTGVDLFFVLSGFLITGILLDRKQSPLAFLHSFYIRRLLRIVPSYLLLVVIFWGAIRIGVHNEAFNADTPWWRHFTFTQNWWMAEHGRWGPSAISVTWSVAIEEQFYLIFPLLVILTPRNRLLAVLAAIAAGSACFRAVAWLAFDNAFAMYVHTLSRLDGLAAGAAIAWLWRAPPPPHALLGMDGKHHLALHRALIGLTCAIPLFLLAIRLNLPLNMAVWGHAYLTLFYSLVLLTIIARLAQGGIPALRQRWLTRLGAVSYTVYLFHPLFLDIVFMLAHRPQRISSVQDIVLALAALGTTLLWAAASLRFLERPLTQAGRSFKY